MARSLQKDRRGKRTHRKKPPRAGPRFQADRRAALSRRETLNLKGPRRKRWKATMRKTRDADLRRRYQVVWWWCEGFRKGDIAAMLCCHRNTVAGVLRTFQDKGELGLIDGRVGNGNLKATEAFIRGVEGLIAGAPDPQWNHTTWTAELLSLVMAEKTGIKVSVPTMCRVLKQLRARKGRPKPVACACPWPAWKRQRRLREIRKLIETAPADELVLFEDEVDLHLNPKIGTDWMLPGTQKEVRTPGQNVKHYIAGAITGWGKALIWVAGPSKCSALFIKLVHQLCQQFPHLKVIHLILDNYIIHTSKITQKAIQATNGKVQLHFLPPYCPKYNKIERLWRDLHARVTRNHQCKTIETLMANAAQFLNTVWAAAPAASARAA